jgi:hypothetical protein
MGEVLGMGMSHGPHPRMSDQQMAVMLRRALTQPNVPPALKNPTSWPEPMRVEWGEDEGVAAAPKHRAQLVEGFRLLRKTLDAFKPDVVLIWGDDQYENFKEDVVPTFCVFIEDEFGWNTQPPAATPQGMQFSPQPDWLPGVKGHRKIAKELAISLLGQKIDIAYAYKQLHHDFSHAFKNTVLYLDWEKQGFPYPIIPFHVNCYGSRLARYRRTEELDPPGPTPERCFEVGAAVARFFQQSPYRAALIGSSSWSHASLTAKHHFLWPDVEADKARHAELARGDYAAWKRIPLAQIEDSGQHEMSNWMCLAGAMDALRRKPTSTQFNESWIFNSSKPMAIFAP